MLTSHLLFSLNAIELLGSHREFDALAVLLSVPRRALTTPQACMCLIIVLYLVERPQRHLGPGWSELNVTRGRINLNAGKALE